MIMNKIGRNIITIDAWRLYMGSRFSLGIPCMEGYMFMFLGLVCFLYSCLHDLVMLVYGVFGMGFLHIGVLFAWAVGKHIDTCLFPTVLITDNNVFLT